MLTSNELRARLAGVSIDDLDAVHDLYLDMKKRTSYSKACFNDIDFAETVRRIERAMGQAIRAGQARGEVFDHRLGNPKDHSRHRLVSDLCKTRGETTPMYQMADGVSDEVFDRAIAYCRKNGALSRPKLLARIKVEQGLAPDLPPEPVAKKVRPTARGRKTIEHMAISINAIAMGVCDLDPAEVDRELMQDTINQVFEDIGIVRTFLRKVNKNAR